MHAVIPRGRHHLEDIIATWTRERPDLDLSNYFFAMFVMRLGRVVDDVYDRLCRKRFGISGADMRVLFALRRAGKPYARRPTDLFRALLVTSGAMTKQVDRLSRLGFVERLDDPTNSAGVLIALTGKGLKATNAATDHLASNSPIGASWSNEATSSRVGRPTPLIPMRGKSLLYKWKCSCSGVNVPTNQLRPAASISKAIATATPFSSNAVRGLWVITDVCG